ncbi:GNAT family N-acetyltransferase [Streptomyces sp. DH24]|uniref:GNAT family N-acetyltransferase n=1 Tax=Streptomyces sp. DH24 TaxID=3040123 RepID=UPI0034DFB6A9
MAEDSDQGVRMGRLHSSLQRAAGGAPGYVRLYELHVSPEFRQRGVARALVDELFARVPARIFIRSWTRRNCSHRWPPARTAPSPCWSSWETIPSG